MLNSKKVDFKLSKPYNNYTKNINTETSDLVKEINQEITYREKYRYDKCYDNYHFR